MKCFVYVSVNAKKKSAPAAFSMLHGWITAVVAEEAEAWLLGSFGAPPSTTQKPGFSSIAAGDCNHVPSRRNLGTEENILGTFGM